MLKILEMQYKNHSLYDSYTSYLVLLLLAREPFRAFWKNMFFPYFKANVSVEATFARVLCWQKKEPICVVVVFQLLADG